MIRHLPARDAFTRGVLFGALLVVALEWLVNITPVADWVAQPLLVSDRLAEADAIVVPGAGVVGDCLPNHHAERRVLRAVRLWREGVAPFILFLGGAGDGACPASEAMRRFAVEVGLPATSARVESASKSTWENATYATPMLRDWGSHQIALVTDRLHMRRATAVFEHQGFSVAPSSVPIFEGHEDNGSMLKAALREYVALAYYRVRGRSNAPTDTSERRRSLTSRMSRRVTGTGPVVILGASYAQSWPLATVGEVVVLNRGVAGQQAADLRARFEQDVLAHRPRAVVIWGFINDVFRSQPDRMEATVAGIQRNYEEMAALARENGVEPILVTELTIRPAGSAAMNALGAFVGALRGRPSYQETINRRVSEINSWLTGFAEREQLLLLDFQAVLADDGQGRRAPFAQPDGSHVSAAGYNALTQYATPILQGFLIAG